MVRLRQLFEEAAGSGCLAMAGLVPDGGIALAGAGLILAFRSRFKDADQRALEAAVNGVVRRARDELVLFYRPGGEEWEQILEENDARRVVMEHVRFVLPARQRIIETGFDIEVLTAETVARLAESAGAGADFSNPESRAGAIARAHVRALLTALEAERGFLAALSPGLTLEIARDVKAMREDLRALADQVSADRQVPVETLRTIARSFDRSLRGEWTRDDLIDFLQDKAEEYRELTRSIDRGRNVSPEITRLRDQAKARLDAGELEAARGLLRQAREAQTRLREEQEAQAARARAEEAELLTEEAQAAALALDYGAAGDLYLQAVELTGRDDAHAAAAQAVRAAGSLVDGAERIGDARGLEAAAALFEASLALRPKDAAAQDWAGVQNDLGIVLRVLGAWRGDDALLARAAQAFEAALAVRTRDAAPDQWAMTLNNQGGVFQALGERRGDEVMLQRAVDAYEDALTVRTREAAPADWAMTQNNLGAVLRALGERRGDEAMLERAIEAHETALALHSAGDRPAGRAKAQTNLANALWTLGLQRRDGALLERAIAAHEAALTVRTREAAPADWAMTQINLGGALVMLGLWREDEALIERAVVAFEGALTVRRRDTAPADWALAQSNLGGALNTLGARRGDEALLERAVAAFEAALSVRTREAAPVDWAMTQNNLGNALQALGAGRRDPAIIERAIAAIDAAAEALDAAGHAAYAATARSNRDRAAAVLEGVKGATP